MNAKVKDCGESRNTTLKNFTQNYDSTSNFASPLDTLAQLGTKEDFEVIANTHCADKKTLLKRAKRKFASHSLAVGLAGAAERNTDSVLLKSYWNSYHCSAVLLKSKNGKITGKYCKCRWCLVCNAIRTAQAINSYSPVLDTWTDAHFATLTQQTVPAEKLVLQLNEMHSIFKSIQELAKRRFQRGKFDFKIVAIRKLECTYNPITKYYHPHYHIITETKQMADFVLSEWIKRNPTAKSKGQDVRKADKGSYKELFKYMTKVIASTGKTTKNGRKRQIHTQSLDVIFNAMRRRRTLQSVGFRLPKIVNTEETKVEHDEVIAILQWHQSVTDWVDMETGETLTNYRPVDAMRELFNGISKADPCNTGFT